ncbi:nucleoside-diphosphate sugar epimerase/dehydratase [Siminovitchia fortis]|uniref:Polysaccharide biosynthesis protein n=1 Tax=Siminovitchia fortis TaxID=254758 RepID=A0A443IPB5_9BACI|nr:nucleoside-diphosphate sugar epimerase/dehydratase [Siminovitchia fortis]RWR07855.1 polysaccharide biosynthesis protein [Siminovitchia fortis]WHY80522.1 nucleoside-diphosphate sugar epimerase/dehydratase [Siminovitchia fortis]
MTYRKRISFFIFVDSCLVLAAVLLGSLLVNGSVKFTFLNIASSIAILAGHHFFSFIFRSYKKAWEYASIGESIVIFKVVSLSIIAASLIQQIMFNAVFFRLNMVIWLIQLLLIGGSRFFWRVYRDNSAGKPPNMKRRTVIIGAGSAGNMVARQLLKENEADLMPVAFIDDDPKKHNLDILGLPVFGGINQIQKVVSEMSVENIIIAIPSLSKKRLNRIFQECAATKAKTQILPMLEDLVTGKVSVKQFRDVQVEDLLGREPIDLDIGSISENVEDKTIMVTGAGGSIGSEICRQICQFNPGKLILLGHGENSIHSIELELKEKFSHKHIEILTEIADLKDVKKILTVMGTYRPDVVYHAAAHKHVPLMERNPEEAVKNNVIGTKNVAEAASWNRVGTFVMISTDKAVNPTSVMGATKRLAEMVVQHMDKKSDTKFVAVRFGNVLGSRGSVIPIFKQQIAKGGPVTVTHPEMVRYFMTIPEASRLVIQAGALAKGGEIFVLDMGEPVKIVDLAKKMIQLSGYSVDDIGIEFTGIRPGEKLFEELLHDDEVKDQQVYPNIYIGETSDLYSEEIEEIISFYNTWDRERLREILINLANNKVNLIPGQLVSASG